MTFLIALVLRMAVKPNQNDVFLAVCSRLSDLPSCHHCDLDVERSRDGHQETPLQYKCASSGIGISRNLDISRTCVRNCIFIITRVTLLCYLPLSRQ